MAMVARQCPAWLAGLEASLATALATAAATVGVCVCGSVGHIYSEVAGDAPRPCSKNKAEDEEDDNDDDDVDDDDDADSDGLHADKDLEDYDSDDSKEGREDAQGGQDGSGRGPVVSTPITETQCVRHEEVVPAPRADPEGPALASVQEASGDVCRAVHRRRAGRGGGGACRRPGRCSRRRYQRVCRRSPTVRWPGLGSRDMWPVRGAPRCTGRPTGGGLTW